MRKFIDVRNLSWPLTPELELNKDELGEFYLYLSPEIVLQCFHLSSLLEPEQWDTDKERQKWANYLRQIADNIYPESNG
ncbi:hypothetical protein C4G95_RS16525 [Vibrio parahaemolyticus]|nr:hypothetical protein [Vibrio parahaemolyticus]EJG0960643.1 hypothetical protein [Vibrio parahaemolyticus]